MCCNWLKGGDSHMVTMKILHTIGHYNWDAKAVLVVAALSTSIGRFRLVYQLCCTNPLAKAIAHLKLFPDGSEFGGNLKPKLEALSLLIKALLDMCKSIVELYELLCNKYFTAESAEIIANCTADVPITVYWTVRSAVDCTSQIYGLTGVGTECVTASVHDSVRVNSLNMCFFCFDIEHNSHKYSF